MKRKSGARFKEANRKNGGHRYTEEPCGCPEGKRRSDLRVFESQILGDLPAYDTFDLAVGIKKNNWTVDLFVKNMFDKRVQYSRFTQCAETVCGNAVPPSDMAYPDAVPPGYENGQVYVFPGQPRTIGVRFTQTF